MTETTLRRAACGCEIEDALEREIAALRARIAELEAENGALRVTVRVNGLRCGATDAQIDAALDEARRALEPRDAG